MLSALTALIVAVAPCAAAQAEAWWGHVQALAHDSMRGRATGSPEHRKAAEYVAAHFRQAGLTPGGTDGFFQPVKFVTRSIVEERSSAALVRDGVPEPLRLGEDAYFVLRAPLAERVEAPLVFVGYGLHIPELGHDDLAGLDLRGKVVVTLPGVPQGLAGPVVSHARSNGWAALRRAGAIGVIVIASPRADVPWARAALARFTPQMTLADEALNTTGGQSLSLTFNPASAERLFLGSGHRFAELLALADSGKPLPRFALPVSIRAVAKTMTVETVSDNVAGILPGSDPRLRNEYVVLSAHLDHVGVGWPIDGDSIYNGAMDNASGIATLIETATAMARMKTRPRRSIVFLAVTAEEKGLLGSRYYAAKPTVPAASIVANLNTDMFLPINPLKALIVNGLEESDLADDAREAAAPLGIAVLSDPEPERNAFVRSDQYSFIQRGIPALSLKAGFTKDSPEHERVKRWRAERYHGPADDLDQPVDRQAAADFNRLYLALVTRVANRATRPAYHADSFFRRFAAPATGAF